MTASKQVAPAMSLQGWVITAQAALLSCSSLCQAGLVLWQSLKCVCFAVLGSIPEIALGTMSGGVDKANTKPFHAWPVFILEDNITNQW